MSLSDKIYCFVLNSLISKQLRSLQILLLVYKTCVLISEDLGLLNKYDCKNIFLASLTFWKFLGRG